MDLKFKELNKLSLMSIAFIVGILAGLGGVLFRKLVALIYNLSFAGKISLFYPGNIHAPVSIWGVGIIIVPVMGSFFVTWLIKNFAAGETGVSIPVIIYATHVNKGKINPVSAFAKIIASAISIGTGGSIGREGPSAQIGAVVSSIIGEIIQLSSQQRILLIAAGAAAGTAAIFNAPFAGLAFAIELFLVSVTIFNIFIVSISIITATFIGYYFFGTAPIFPFITHVADINISATIMQILAVIPLGIVIGLVAALFILSLYRIEDFFNLHFKNIYLRHASGMCLVGIMMYLLMKFSGHYYIEGTGFSTIQDTLNFMIKNFWLLIILFLTKSLATCLTLGSGAAGGIFSPTLFLGATLGTVFGLALHDLFPAQMTDPVLFVVAGMAGMVGSVTGVVITAILLILEITREFQLVLPIIITTLIAYVIRVKLHPESVYTLKLARSLSLPAAKALGP